MAETVGYVNRARAFMPTGTVPPFVMRFDAGSVPVGDLVFSDETRKVRRQGLAGRRPLPGASAVRDLAGRISPTAIRRQPASHRDQRRSRPAARLQYEPGRGRPGHHEGQHDQPIRQRALRQRDTDGSGELGGDGRRDVWATSPSAPTEPAPSSCAISERSPTLPISKSATRSSMAAAPSTFRSPNAPTPRRSVSSISSRRISQSSRPCCRRA